MKKGKEYSINWKYEKFLSMEDSVQYLILGILSIATFTELIITQISDPNFLESTGIITIILLLLILTYPIIKLPFWLIGGIRLRLK